MVRPKRTADDRYIPGKSMIRASTIYDFLHTKSGKFHKKVKENKNKNISNL